MCSCAAPQRGETHRSTKREYRHGLFEDIPWISLNRLEVILRVVSVNQLMFPGIVFPAHRLAITLLVMVDCGEPGIAVVQCRTDYIPFLLVFDGQYYGIYNPCVEVARWSGQCGGR